MKYIIPLAVTALIIVVPFGSWYYLQTGLNYRKAIAEELVAKGKVGEDVRPLLAGHTSLVVAGGSSDGFRDTLAQVYDQYRESITFQLVELDSAVSSLGSRHILSNQKLDFLPAGAAMALIDTAGVIRSTYARSAKDVSKAIEHLAVVIPKPQPRDIKMKSGSDYDAKPSFMKKNK